jgi:ABC-2 type transport system permease protein
VTSLHDAVDRHGLLVGVTAEIVVDNLTKQYKKVRAVDGLSFGVRSGRVTGFLGPNGAGKTTTLLAKLAASVLLGLLFWLVTTIGNLIAVPFILRSMDLGSQLGEPAIWRASGLNALALALWAILGVGFGVLIRSQLGATLTLSIAYVIGNFGVTLAFFLLTDNVARWISKLQVIVPDDGVAADDRRNRPSRQSAAVGLGAAVLIGYALVAGAIGTLIMRRRDIS